MEDGDSSNILFVSDGSDVTQSQGWLNKMKRRWQNAPSIEEWEKRIITHLPKQSESYKKQEGVYHAILLIAKYFR